MPSRVTGYIDMRSLRAASDCAQGRRGVSSARTLWNVQRPALVLTGVRSAVLCVSILLCSSTAGALNPTRSSLLDRTATPVAIELLASPDVSDSIINGLCDETAAIWQTAGVTFNWYRSGRYHSAGSERLEVTIDDRRYGASEWQEALGWITFTPAGPDTWIHLSLTSTEDLIRRTTIANTTIAAHDTMVGRALGRALAHELGHYFLRSKAHAPRGLMRATRPSDEFFSISRMNFQLTAQEREAALENVHADPLAEGER